MAYNPANLTPTTITDLAWALAWARFFLRDTGTPETYSDAELVAVLTAHAFTHDSVTYFRPHVAAAQLVMSDPDRVMTESLLGASVTHRNPQSVASGIRQDGRWIDEVIQNDSGVRVPTGRTLIARW